jgi:hypothetical protein
VSAGEGKELRRRLDKEPFNRVWDLLCIAHAAA